MQVIILKDSVSGPADHWRSYEVGQTLDMPEDAAISMIRAGHARPERDDEKPKTVSKVERTIRRGKKHETR